MVHFAKQNARKNVQVTMKITANFKTIIQTITLKSEDGYFFQKHLVDANKSLLNSYSIYNIERL